MMKGINLLIAISALDQCDTHFMMSMLRMIQKHPEYDVLPEINSLVYQSRDSLAFYAIQNNYDYICFIDTDETFKPDDVEVLLKDSREIVGGVVCKREFPYQPIIYHYNDTKPYEPWETSAIPKEFSEVDALGTGALLLIKVSTLRKIHSLTGDLFAPMNHWSEDLSFFFRARQCGIKTYCDPRIKIGHRGKQTVTTEFWEAVSNGRD